MSRGHAPTTERLVSWLRAWRAHTINVVRETREFHLRPALVDGTPSRRRQCPPAAGRGAVRVSTARAFIAHRLTPATRPRPHGRATSSGSITPPASPAPTASSSRPRCPHRARATSGQCPAPARRTVRREPAPPPHDRARGCDRHTSASAGTVRSSARPGALTAQPLHSRRQRGPHLPRGATDRCRACALADDTLPHCQPGRLLLNRWDHASRGVLVSLRFLLGPCPPVVSYTVGGHPSSCFMARALRSMKTCAPSQRRNEPASSGPAESERERLDGPHRRPAPISEWRPSCAIRRHADHLNRSATPRSRCC